MKPGNLLAFRAGKVPKGVESCAKRHRAKDERSGAEAVVESPQGPAPLVLAGSAPPRNDGAETL